MSAPVASGWSGRLVGLLPLEKRRLVTAHVENRPSTWLPYRAAPGGQQIVSQIIDLRFY